MVVFGSGQHPTLSAQRLQATLVPSQPYQRPLAVPAGHFPLDMPCSHFHKITCCLVVFFIKSQVPKTTLMMHQLSAAIIYWVSQLRPRGSALERKSPRSQRKVTWSPEFCRTEMTERISIVFTNINEFPREKKLKITTSGVFLYFLWPFSIPRHVALIEGVLLLGFVFVIVALEVNLGLHSCQAIAQ